MTQRAKNLRIIHHAVPITARKKSKSGYIQAVNPSCEVNFGVKKNPSPEPQGNTRVATRVNAMLDPAMRVFRQVPLGELPVWSKKHRADEHSQIRSVCYVIPLEARYTLKVMRVKLEGELEASKSPTCDKSYPLKQDTC